jgi:hypothetical protein
MSLVEKVFQEQGIRIMLPEDWRIDEEFLDKDSVKLKPSRGTIENVILYNRPANGITFDQFLQNDGILGHIVSLEYQSFPPGAQTFFPGAEVVTRALNKIKIEGTYERSIGIRNAIYREIRLEEDKIREFNYNAYDRTYETYLPQVKQIYNSVQWRN